MTRARATLTVVLRRHGHNAWLAQGPGTAINNLMGRFEAAQLVEGLGYIIGDEHRPAFERYATHVGMSVVDSALPTPGPVIANPLPECVHCAQPASRHHPPRYCPGCGQPWRERPAETHDADNHPRQTCPECGHNQRGAWRNCARCGHTMPPPERGTRPPAITLVRGGEPVPLAHAIADALPALAPETP